MPNKALQHRSASLHWTVCKLRFCGFASQKYSTTHNLQTAAELGVSGVRPKKTVTLAAPSNGLTIELVRRGHVWSGRFVHLPLAKYVHCLEPPMIIWALYCRNPQP